MTAYLSLLFIFGILVKLGYACRLEKWLRPSVLWRDIFLFSLVVSLYIEPQGNSLLVFCGFPLAILFSAFGKRNSNENDVLLCFLFLAFPATELLDLNSKAPFLLSSLFALVYSFREGFKNTKLPSLFLALFWILSLKFPEGIVFSLIAPLGLVLSVINGLSSEREPALEYAFLLTSIGLVFRMEALPVWLKTSIAFLILIGLMFSKLSFVRLCTWSVLAVPLLLTSQSEGAVFQLYTFLILPIIFELFRILIKEIKSFKVSGSNEVVMSYQQIVLLLLIVLIFGGFRGTIFSVIFPTLKSFSYGLFLFSIFFIVPIKHLLVTEKPLEFQKQDEVYLILRSLLMFLVLFFCAGSFSLGFNYFALVLAFMALGVGFVFRTKKEMEESLKHTLQKLELSMGQASRERRLTALKNPKQTGLMGSYEKWHGYSYSFEISLVFVGLLFLIYWEGL
ncbi:MAG: hypothetical protein NXH75_01500 [Halobacteriovoraceae bacterium]|nr:hypothetical protein [Halobacteriovoraceae bacterium]